MSFSDDLRVIGDYLNPNSMTTFDDMTHRLEFAKKAMLSAAKMIYHFAQVCFSLLNKVKEKGTPERKEWKKALVQAGIRLEKRKRELIAFLTAMFDPIRGVKQATSTRILKPFSKAAVWILN